MLDLAKVEPNDVVYDLGSGDGRIVITAVARSGVRAVGIEHDPRLIELSERNASEAGVLDRVEFRREDLFVSDLRDATVVTMYLTPKFMKKLAPRLQEQLRPGTRIVTHQYRIPGWTAVEETRIKRRKLYLYIVTPEGEAPARSDRRR
jgi:cyclopropane fatty-acyl-phospholipid synthase-like methyltransferase